MPHSPLGRGFLTGGIASLDALGANDWRCNMPRFRDGNLERNLSLVATLQGLAKERGLTAAQIALACMLNREPALVPIPGARKIAHLEENVGAADIALSPADMAAIEAAVPETAVAGGRSPESAAHLLNK